MSVPACSKETQALQKVKSPPIGTSLVVRWLRLCLAMQGVGGLNPGWGTKIPWALEQLKAHAAQQLSRRASAAECVLHRETPGAQPRAHASAEPQRSQTREQRLRPSAARHVNRGWKDSGLPGPATWRQALPRGP